MNPPTTALRFLINTSLRRWRSESSAVSLSRSSAPDVSRRRATRSSTSSQSAPVARLRPALHRKSVVTEFLNEPRESGHGAAVAFEAFLGGNSAGSRSSTSEYSSCVSSCMGVAVRKRRLRLAKWSGSASLLESVKPCRGQASRAVASGMVSLIYGGLSPSPPSSIARPFRIRPSTRNRVLLEKVKIFGLLLAFQIADSVGIQDIEGLIELRVHLELPLADQVGRDNDQHSLGAASGSKLLDHHTGFNCLAQADLVAQEKSVRVVGDDFVNH